MKVHEEEKALESTLLAAAKATANIVVPMAVAKENSELFIENLESIKKSGCLNEKIHRSLAKIAEFEHPDLMYGSAILVSTVMNKNDDVFLSDETWKARNTAINVPYNDDHVEIDIIGHTIAARPLDSEGKLIEADEPPGYFDIEVDFVMYRGIFPAIAKDILENAPKGRKFVSMEAKFRDFDYGLVDEKGSMKIVARNNETAFLTKYLRAYGGEGRYENYKMARVLRDFRFTGVGNVDTPANPGSEYTRFDDYELASQSNFREQSQVVLYITKGNIMEIKTLEDAKQVIADLNQKLAQREGQEAEQLKAQVTTLTGEKNTVAQELEAEKAKVNVATQELDAVKAQLETVKTELEAAKSDAASKAAELAKIQQEAKAGERVAQLKELGVEVNDEKRKEVTEWSDATFASVLEFTKTVKPAPKKEEGTDAAAVAAATKKAEDDLAKAEKDKADQGNVTDTAGENTPEGEKIQKTAAKLVSNLRSLNTKNRNPKESK